MTRALGCDVSHWDGKIDFARMKAGGASFVFIKASEGLNIDLKFLEYWRDAKAAGLLRGVYHYLNFHISILDQAKRFCDIIAANGGGELPAMIDFEMDPEGATFPQYTQSMRQAFLWQVIDYMQKNLNITPGIYSGYPYWTAWGNPGAGWAKYPLWMAAYTPESWVNLHMPKPWSNWEFWQYSNKGIPASYGCSSAGVDINLYNGTVEQLQEKYGAAVAISVVPTPVPVLTLEERVIRLEKIHNL